MVTHHPQDGHPSSPGRLATINVCAHEDTIPSTTEEEESTSNMSKFVKNDAEVFEFFFGFLWVSLATYIYKNF